jgi:hypothetical protein
MAGRICRHSVETTDEESLSTAVGGIREGFLWMTNLIQEVLQRQLFCTRIP